MRVIVRHRQGGVRKRVPTLPGTGWISLGVNLVAVVGSTDAADIRVFVFLVVGGHCPVCSRLKLASAHFLTNVSGVLSGRQSIAKYASSSDLEGVLFPPCCLKVVVGLTKMAASADHPGMRGTILAFRRFASPRVFLGGGFRLAASGSGGGLGIRRRTVILLHSSWKRKEGSTNVSVVGSLNKRN